MGIHTETTIIRETPSLDGVVGPSTVPAEPDTKPQRADPPARPAPSRPQKDEPGHLPIVSSPQRKTPTPSGPPGDVPNCEVTLRKS